MLIGYKCVSPPGSDLALDASDEFRSTAKPSETIWSKAPGIRRTGTGCRMFGPEGDSRLIYLKKAAAKVLASALAGKITPINTLD